MSFGVFRRLAAAAALVIGSAAAAVAAAQPAGAGQAAAHQLAVTTASTSQNQSGSVCIGRHPNASAVWYTGACSGHDEPEIDPVSSLPGSAQDLTWTAILPKDGTVPVSAVGPTFWWGGTVTDPNPHSLFNQAFLELQFYPDAIVNTCASDGGFSLTFAKDKYSVCSPTWQVSTTSGAENAAFNAELFDGSSNAPLVMNAGDTIQVHFFVTSPTQGWNIHVTDLTTGHSGTIVLNSKYGPMLPAFSAQQIGNALGWGLVDDTPNSFVWEIGHTSDFATPGAQFCLPGQTICDSYDTPHWLGFTPLKIVSVTFADNSSPTQWAVVSDLGASAEVTSSSGCPSYGGPFCTYPWYAFNSTAAAFTFGADYPGTKFDYGQGFQYTTTMQCGGPFGPDSTFCDTILKPTP
ncbi:MAG TPA: hypothetical protein VNF47_04485 [Streptosporangiaceae bacterium]|nr:hypothetical protein [Streptosporangiaceae bacterium]